MSNNDIVGLIIAGALGLLFITFSIVLLTGRGSFLIAGYNTMSKDEKSKYDSQSLCKFMGKIFLPIGILTPVVAVGGIFNIAWIYTAYPIVIFSLVIFAMIYSNTGNRFKK